jgi:hypothetical protein
MAKPNHFPWHAFQLWLRDGFFAGFVLNKVMVASWPESQRPFKPVTHPEELKLLGEALKWVRTTGEKADSVPLERLANLAPGSEYPHLSDEDARTLWRILSQYGVLTLRYKSLHSQVREFVIGFDGDVDAAIRGGMDAVWRSIGPALDPNRKNVEKAAAEKAA